MLLAVNIVYDLQDFRGTSSMIYGNKSFENMFIRIILMQTLNRYTFTPKINKIIFIPFSVMNTYFCICLRKKSIFLSILIKSMHAAMIRTVWHIMTIQILVCTYTEYISCVHNFCFHTCILPIGISWTSSGNHYKLLYSQSLM